MASATLEMFIKIVGANKVANALGKVSNELKDQQQQVIKNDKVNKQFAAGMSGLSKAAIAGGTLFAARTLADFSLEAIRAASSAQEAAGAFGTTFGDAAEQLGTQLERNANLFGLTSSEAQQLISVFGSVAQGIGFTQEESADLSSELFDLAGDIASFNNITAGAAPVLNAFRSALVGEREALKTYGIAITEAEVQTKAFEQTGKTSADALTRQEKALATSALIFERATVQQGNAAREASGFAAQTLIARSATQELREELGEELLPAAGEVLRVFNEIREDSTPALIDRFSDLNLQILGLVSGFEFLRESLSFNRDSTEENLRSQLASTSAIVRIGAALKTLGIIRKTEIAAEKAQQIQTENTIEQFEHYVFAQEEINRSIQKHRTQTQINRVEQEKYNNLLNKKSIPTLEKYLKFMNMINGDNEETIDRSKELRDAQENLTEAQRQEALSTAEEALQKKELQKEIAELLFFQQQGVDVSEELRVAEEKLKLVEFELTRESEILRDAKKQLNDIESELVSTVETSTDKLEDQIKTYISLNEQVGTFKELSVNKEFLKILAANNALNPFLATGLDLMSQLASIEGLDERARELGRFADAAERLANVPDVPIQAISTPVTATVPMFGQQELAGFQAAGFQGGQQKLEIVLQVEEEEIQRVNTTIQQRGKSFLIQAE